MYKKDFETTIGGQKVGLFTIANMHGLTAKFTNYGQRLVSLMVPDGHGVFDDVVLGYSTLEDYLKTNQKYYGAVIGRYANRIAGGRFTLDDREYELATNYGGNHMHGGKQGFESVVWKVDKISSNELNFSRMSRHMEEGYPGNVIVQVNYILTDTNELRIQYTAQTDQKTVINLTHHSYFNLRGAKMGSINEHLLIINADFYTPINANMIPTGILESVVATPFDFTEPKRIGKDLGQYHEQLKFGGGYDHNFVLDQQVKSEDGLIVAAKVIEPDSGRTMEVFTNEPGIQFYSGSSISSSILGKGGKAYRNGEAFCLETQHFPNSPNQSNFPSTVLQPDEKYESICVYKFNTI
ncbi:galactose mutarotase [Croceitalea sp. MTPC5]|uniref:aldose epimerase family protein n=1 Tax=Croceitalea sp. MTPC5 TaxID=3056565 RepID=UPI002B39F273|nr:galactose mutarotase [Croceitalea sp. MTPC5]